MNPSTACTMQQRYVLFLRKHSEYIVSTVYIPIIWSSSSTMYIWKWVNCYCVRWGRMYCLDSNCFRHAIIVQFLERLCFEILSNVLVSRSCDYRQSIQHRKWVYMSVLDLCESVSTFPDLNTNFVVFLLFSTFTIHLLTYWVTQLPSGPNST